MKNTSPDKITSYLSAEVPLLIGTAVTGMIYNSGLIAGPLFEGLLAQALYDIYEGRRTFSHMVRIVLVYLAITSVVQLTRFLKRLYVRRFANKVSRSMKETLYGHLLMKSRTELEKEGAGALITKAVADVDTCAEGMRKFLTEVFDTGVALAAYLIMLFVYDWRLTLLSLIFMPVPYVIAALLKKPVTRAFAAAKESNGRLNQATLDRIDASLLYRITGQEKAADSRYAEKLMDYEKKSVLSGILESAPQHLYRSITYLGVIFVLYFGSRNVLGTGWTSWDIAAFTAFLSCFARLAVKSSKVAKLFNSVQKARASWSRIKPLMSEVKVAEAKANVTTDENTSDSTSALILSGSSAHTFPAELTLKARDLSFTYEGDSAPVLSGISFTAHSGQLIGVTGPVACGKSTLGRIFLMENDYTGALTINGRELRDFTPAEIAAYVSYMGHDPELMSDTIRENVLLGSDGDIDRLLKDVDIYDEVASMDLREDTPIGVGGIRLSGGQQQRIALARTLRFSAPIMVLDDPFSALDRTTERHVLNSIRKHCPNSIVFLITHRTYLLEAADLVLHLDHGRLTDKEGM